MPFVTLTSLEGILDPWNNNPWLLFDGDVLWILWNFNLVLRTFFNALAFNMTNEHSELYVSPRAPLVALYNLAALLLQLLMLACSPLVAIEYLWERISGFQPPHKHVDGQPHVQGGREKWLFVNGIAVNSWWLHQNCKFLGARFRKEIVGVPNSSYGIFWDLVECLLQRDFNIHTISVCDTASTVIEHLRNPDVDRVVLLSHSQGTIIANLAVQRIFLELSQPPAPGGRVVQRAMAGAGAALAAAAGAPAVAARGETEAGPAAATPGAGAGASAAAPNDVTLMRKLEVYTFACASRQFLNPGGHIRCIEHYVNMDDPVAMLGAVGNSTRPPQPPPPAGVPQALLEGNDFSGPIFGAPGRKGHLLASFYSMNSTDYTKRLGWRKGKPSLLEENPLPTDFPRPLMMWCPF